MGIFDKLFGKKQEKEKKYRPKKDWSFYANRANTYLMEGKFTEAIADYTKAIESLPKPRPRSLEEMYHEPPPRDETFLLFILPQELMYFRGIAYYNRGLSTHSKDEFEHAIADLKLMTLGGGFGHEPQKWAKATLMCGDAYFEIGDYRKAANCYNELLKRWIGIAEFLIPITESGIEGKRDIALSIPNIGKLKGKRDVEGLIKALGHKVAKVRWHAAKALGEIKDKKAVEPLIETLLGDKDSYVRSGAAKALGNVGDKKSVKPLIRALEDKDSYVRSDVALALGKIGDERVVELLNKILEDENEDVRVRRVATEALKKIQKKQR